MPQTVLKRSLYLDDEIESFTTQPAAATMQSHSSSFGVGGSGVALALQSLVTAGQLCSAVLVGV